MATYLYQLSDGDETTLTEIQAGSDKIARSQAALWLSEIVRDNAATGSEFRLELVVSTSDGRRLCRLIAAFSDT